MAHSYVWLLAFYGPMMVTAFCMEFGMAGLPGLPAFLLAFIAPLLPSWLAALGATAPAGSRRARCSAWAWALAARLRPQQYQHTRIRSGHTGQGISAGARLAALELLMLFALAMRVLQPLLVVMLLPKFSGAWLARMCQSMRTPVRFYTFFPVVLVTGEQVGGACAGRARQEAPGGMWRVAPA